MPSEFTKLIELARSIARGSRVISEALDEIAEFQKAAKQPERETRRGPSPERRMAAPVRSNAGGRAARTNPKIFRSRHTDRVGTEAGVIWAAVRDKLRILATRETRARIFGSLVLIEVPASEPLLDREERDAYIAKGRHVIASLQRDQLPRLTELGERAASAAIDEAGLVDQTGAMGKMATDAIQDAIESWRGKVEGLLETAAQEIDDIEARLTETAGKIEELQQTPAFPPGSDRADILDRFERGLAMGGGDIVRLVEAAKGSEGSPLAKFRAMSEADEHAMVASWHASGIGPEDAGLICQCAEAYAVWQALSLRKLDRLPIVAEFAELAKQALKMLRQMPDVAFPMDEEASRSLVRALVLTSESKWVHFPLEAVRSDSVAIDITGFDASRLGRFAERLEASAKATIGIDSWDDTSRGFGYWHLALLSRIRQALGLTGPSAADSAWKNHLALRETTRARLLDEISLFWRAMFTDLLDRKTKGWQERDADWKEALLPIGRLDTVAREAILRDAEGVANTFTNTELALAARSLDCDMTTTTVSRQFVGSDKLSLFRHLRDVLKSSPEDQQIAFTPNQPQAEVGAFQALVDDSEEGRDSAILRGIQDLLVRGEFIKAERLTRRWIELSPDSELRTALLAARWEDMNVVDWHLVDSWAANPTTAAIGLDFSEHVVANTLSPGDHVPFELGRYDRSAFKCALTPDGLREEARRASWQGEFEEVDIGASVAGIAPILLPIKQHREAMRKDWPSERRAMHHRIEELAKLHCYVLVNQVIARAVGSRPFPHDIPLIVGDHDFGAFPYVPHFPSKA